MASRTQHSTELGYPSIQISQEEITQAAKAEQQRQASSLTRQIPERNRMFLKDMPFCDERELSFWTRHSSLGITCRKKQGNFMRHHFGNLLS